MNVHAPSPATRRNETLLGAVTATVVLIVLAAGAGHVRGTEIAALTLCVVAVAASRRMSRDQVVRTLFGLSLLVAIAALFVPAHRGTHRWLALGPLQLHAALAVCTTTTLQVACARSLRAKFACAAAGVFVLLLSASVTLATVTLVASLLPLGSRLVRREGLVVLGVLLLGLAAAIIANANRSARVSDFLAGSPARNYQVEQARYVVGETSWIGPSAARHWTLPCASNDYAFLDIVRSLGFAAGVAWIVAQTLLVGTLLLLAARVTGQRAQVCVHAACLLGLLALGHLLVNLTLLPPTGVPAAFTGTGGSTWAIIGFVALFPFVGASSGATARFSHARVKRAWVVPVTGAVAVVLAVLTWQGQRNPPAPSAPQAPSFEQTSGQEDSAHGTPDPRKRAALVVIDEARSETAAQLLQALADVDPRGRGRVLVRTLPLGSARTLDPTYRAIQHTSAGYGGGPLRTQARPTPLMTTIMDCDPRYVFMIEEDQAETVVRCRNGGVDEAAIRTFAHTCGTGLDETAASDVADYVCSVLGHTLVHVQLSARPVRSRHLSALASTLCSLSRVHAEDAP